MHVLEKLSEFVAEGYVSFRVGELAVSIFAELLEFLGTRKKFWLFPLLAMFLIFGGLFVLSQGSVVAPFIYSLF